MQLGDRRVRSGDALHSSGRRRRNSRRRQRLRAHAGAVPRLQRLQFAHHPLQRRSGTRFTPVRSGARWQRHRRRCGCTAAGVGGAREPARGPHLCTDRGLPRGVGRTEPPVQPRLSRARHQAERACNARRDLRGRLERRGDRSGQRQRVIIGAVRPAGRDGVARATWRRASAGTSPITEVDARTTWGGVLGVAGDCRLPDDSKGRRRADHKP